MFKIKVVQKIRIHILCSNRAVHNIMSKNLVDPDRPQIILNFRYKFSQNFMFC